MSLQALNLGCARAEQWIWQNVEFALSPGKILQITGANGCGKTTLLRILAGFKPPHAGTIYWQGRAIHTQLNNYQQKINYLDHQPAIKNDLTVKENLQFSSYKLKNSLYQTAIETMGLHLQAHCFGYQLSQGQKQRLALARLLLIPAPLWILDEPLSSLDIEMLNQLQVIFLQHIKKGGMIVLSTHQPLTQSDLSHYIFQLDLTDYNSPLPQENSDRMRPY